MEATYKELTVTNERKELTNQLSATAVRRRSLQPLCAKKKGLFLFHLLAL